MKAALQVLTPPESGREITSAGPMRSALFVDPGEVSSYRVLQRMI